MVLLIEDEYYKAAYYKGGGTNAGYWDYATQSDSVPGTDYTETTNPGNNAAYKPAIGAPLYPPGDKAVAEVGEFELSVSAYGTFDQGGNFREWVEPNVGETIIQMHGGGYAYPFNIMMAASRNGTIYRRDTGGLMQNGSPASQSSDQGFRVMERAVFPFPGDADDDGDVDGDDAAILAANWLSNDASWGEGDFNGDRIVDDKDATLLAANWQHGVDSGSVPEPNMAVVLVSALMSVLFLRKRAG